jgi:hypothetical protein
LVEEKFCPIFYSLSGNANVRNKLLMMKCSVVLNKMARFEANITEFAFWGDDILAAYFGHQDSSTNLSNYDGLMTSFGL